MFSSSEPQTKGKRTSPSDDESDDFQLFMRRSERREQLLLNTLDQVSQTLVSIHKEMCKYQQQSLSHSTKIVDLLGKLTNSTMNADFGPQVGKSSQKLRSPLPLSGLDKERQTKKAKEQDKLKQSSVSLTTEKQTLKNYIIKRQQSCSIMELIDDRLVWSSQIRRWIGCTYDSILNEAFSLYHSNKIDITQAKVLASGRFLANYHDFLRRAENSERHHVDVYMQASKDTLEYYLSKYPQRQRKIQINHNWKEIDLLEDPLDGIISVTRSYFPYNSKENYYKQIKQFLNELIKLSCSYENCFIATVQKIFNGVGSINIKTKFNKSTPLFSEQQINQNHIQIKNEQMLKVILKWIEQLQQMFQKPHRTIKKMFLNRQNNSVLKLDPSLASKFSRSLSECKSFKASFFNVIQQASSKIYQFIEKQGKKFEYLSLSEVISGLSSHLMTKVIFDVTAYYLNKLISTIQQSFLKACSQQQDDYTKLAEDLELITFGVDDLFEAQCKNLEVFQLLQVLQTMTNIQAQGDIQIVRVRDELNSDYKEFVINFKMTGCPLVCKLRLQVKEKNTLKEEHSSKFNKFILKLIKSKYGPFAKASLIYNFQSNLEKYFNERLSNEKRTLKKGIVSEIICEQKGQLFINGYKQFYEPIFICSSCLKVSTALSSSTPCFKNSHLSICYQCVLSLMSPDQRVLFCLGKDYAQFFQETHELRPFACVVQLDSISQLKFYSSQSLGKYYQLWTESLIIKDKSTFKKSICFGIKNQIKYIKVSLDKARKSFGTISLEQILLDIGIKTDLTAEMLFEPRKIIELSVLAGKVPCSNIDAFICAIHPSQPLLLLTDCYRSPSSLTSMVSKQTLSTLVSSLQKHDVWDLSSNQIHYDIFKEFNLDHVKKLVMENCGLLQFPKIVAKSLENLKIAQNAIQELNFTNLYPYLNDLDISENKLRSIRVEEGVTNRLQILNLSNNRLKSVNLSLLSRLNNLTQLFLQNNLIDEIQPFESDFPILSTLIIDNNRIEKLNFLSGKFNLLQILSINNNGLQIVEVTERNQLKFLLLNNNSRLVYLCLKNLRSLQNLQSARCSIKVLELIGLPCLKYLALNSNLLTSIDTQNLLTLKTLDVSDNRIQELTLGTSPLEHLKLNYNYIVELNLAPLGSFPKLKVLESSFNLLERINLSSQTTFLFLEFLDLRYNIRAIPLSNIPLQLQSLPKLSQFLIGYNSASFDYCWWCLRNSGSEFSSDDENLKELMKGYRSFNKSNIVQKKRRLIMQKSVRRSQHYQVFNLMKFKAQLGVGGIFSDHINKLFRESLKQ